MFIQQIELGVGDRFADVRSKTVFTSHRHPTGVSRGFRRAIEVAQAFDRGLFEQRFHQTALEGFTGHVHRVHALAQSTGFQQRLERRRHGVDQGDVVLAVLQFQHISHDFDAAAAGQRCKALVHGQVEVQRGREQGFRQGLCIERTMRPGQEVDRIAVFDHHALGQTGRTGGVDHIGQVRRSQLDNLRIRDGLVLPEPATQIDYRHRSSGQQPEGRRLGQNHRWSTVLQHVGDPIRRIGRIQRHITTARLEDRQQTHDHVGTTLDADRHPRIRPHTLPAQVMRQSVGPLVQLGIGQALPAMQHRQRLRRTLHLFLEQPMNGLLQRIIGVGGVERHQQLLALRLRQNRQIGQRRLRRTFQRLGQTHQRRFHIGTDPRRADPAHRLDGEAEIFTQIVHREHQWIVGPLFATEHLDTVPGRHRIGRSRRASVAVVEQGTEQRRGCEHAAATLSQSQGGVLVAKQRGQACMGRLDPGAHTLRTHAHPQRQGVDEHAQRPVGALTPLHPAHQHGAEHHIIASRHASQHLGPGQVDQARGTYAKLTRLGPQAQAQAAGERQCGFLDAHACTLHLLQAEWQGRLIDIAQHLAEEPFMGFSTHAQAHLCHVVAKRYRRRQCIGPAEQECLHLMLHQLQGCVVQRHVVEQQDRHPAAVGPIFSTDQAHQRRPAQVQTVVPGIETLVQLPLDIAFGRIEHQLLQGQSGFAPDHLHRLFQPLPHHRGTQDVVTIDHALQGLEKIIQASPLIRSEQGLQHIGITLLGGKVMVENAFLQGRQRVDVLDIAGTTGHTVDDPVDLFLSQAGQRQHVRCNAERRAQPVATVSLHQGEQFMLMDGQTVPYRALQPFVIALDHKVFAILLETNRVLGKRCHQFAELHRRTCFSGSEWLTINVVFRHGVSPGRESWQWTGRSPRAGQSNEYRHVQPKELRLRDCLLTGQKKLEHSVGHVCHGKQGQVPAGGQAEVNPVGAKLAPTWDPG
ncbi:hypothetical protein SRABI112_05274 [Pseudomonas mediterranea]|nr:hypothetical protein SRABI112_05274 [Pseudomonas mediterranea]